jgi:hypothetical protein
MLTVPVESLVFGESGHSSMVVVELCLHVTFSAGCGLLNSREHPQAIRRVFLAQLVGSWVWIQYDVHAVK